MTTANRTYDNIHGIDVYFISGYYESSYIDKLSGGVGTTKFGEYSLDIDKTLGVIYVGTERGDRSVEIYFKMPTTPEEVPSVEMISKMLDEVLKPGNKHEIDVMFNSKFFTHEITELHKKLFGQFDMPLITPDQYDVYKLANVSISKKQMIMSNVYDHKIDGVMGYHLDLQTRKLHIQLKNFEKVVANIDHEAYYNHWVGEGDVVEILTKLFPKNSSQHEAQSL